MLTYLTIIVLSLTTLCTCNDSGSEANDLLFLNGQRPTLEPRISLELGSYYHQHFNKQENILLKDPSYIIMAPRIVRAGYPYRLVVNVLPPSPSLIVVGTLFKDNIQVDVMEKECHVDEPQIMEIMVPSSSSFGNYRLKLEGNEFGWLTGTAFTEAVNLEFSHKGATIVIQTDKTIYKPGGIVKMRIVALNFSAQVTKDAVDILILSPRGVIVKRWLSRQCLEGAILLDFALSPMAEEGQWVVRVEASNSFAEKLFTVQEMFPLRFEVRVETPPFLSSDEEFLRGAVFANYHSGAPVVGNISVRAAWKPAEEGDFPFDKPSTSQSLRRKPEKRNTFWDTFFSSESNDTRNDHFGGLFEFKFRLSSFDFLTAPNTDGELMITATVGDAIWDTSQVGVASTRIFNPHIHLQFMGKSPHILRPPMPFSFHLTASLSDGSHVSSFRLAKHRLIVRPEVKFRSGSTRRLYPRSIKMTHDQYGLWQDEIDLYSELGEEDKSEEISSLKLEAELKDSLGRRSYASLVAVSHYSPDGRFIQVSTSSKNPKVGEYVIFHVRSNFYFDRFRYILLSKGMVIEGGQESMEASLKTFPLALTPEMSGSSKLVVYVLERGKNIVSDAITFPVDALTESDFRIEVKEDTSKNHIKITVEGSPGSRVSLSGIYYGTLQTRAAESVSASKILEELSSSSDIQKSNPQNLFEMNWVSHTMTPNDVVRLSAPSYGGDVNETFRLADLTLLSDGDISFRPSPCRFSRGFLPCLLGGCFSSSSECDRKWDCIDRIDERDCPTHWEDVNQEITSFRIRRQSRIRTDFNPPWLWEDIILGAEGKMILSVPSPDRISNLGLHAFAIHANSRLSILQEEIRITTSPSYWLWIEAPERVTIWEQVGVRVTVVNRLKKDLPGVVVLTDNPNYKFVSLEEFESSQPLPHFRVRHPNAVKRMISGDHTHSLSIPSGEATTIYLPIVPVALGPLNIEVQAVFPGVKTLKSTIIYVEPMGILQERHTSFLLDLNNKAYLFTFLDVQVPSHPDIQGTDVTLSVFGDLVDGDSTLGVANSDETFHLPQIGAEPLGFSIMMTLLKLKRWKKLEQKPDKNEKKIFSDLSVAYQSLLPFQNNDGGFKIFFSSTKSSVWVTVFVLRILNELSQNWQHFLYVDSQVTDKALRFMLRHQTDHGAFFETKGSLGNRHLEAGSAAPLLTQFNTRGLNLSLTAFSLIQLKSLTNIPEPLDEFLAESTRRGRKWLEDNLELVGEASKPLEISLVALALQMFGSRQAEKAFTILARNARQEGEQYVYWGEDLVPLPSYRVEDNRPYLQPRQPHRHDSGNVAATACALRVYAGRGELLTPAIVRWLQSQRVHDGGWSSTFDTLLAWEALSEYSDSEDKSRNTRLVITVEPMADLSSSRVFYITPNNLLSLQKYDMGDDIGSITVQGKGKGSAVMQLNFQYYVSNPYQLISPPTQAFQLETTAISSGRNSSKISFETCVLWKYTSVSESSGIAVLEVTVPTGYGIQQTKLEEYVASSRVPSLHSASFRPRLVSFHFQEIGPTETCVEFSVDRWFPVANLTRILPVKIYEYYSPELYAIELLDMSSITLDICQVCGSYQCPNCPVLSYYSSKGCQIRVNCTFKFLLLFLNVSWTLQILFFKFQPFAMFKFHLR